MLSDAQIKTIDVIEERSEIEDQVGLDPEADEVPMPARRLALMRGLVLGAIRRYDETLAARRAIWDVIPKRPRSMTGVAFDAEEVAILERAEVEWDAWKLLSHEAGSDFDSAERSLAERIQALYDALAAEHDPVRGPRSPHGGELAVKLGETTYVLASDANEYEPETNMIAIIRDANVIDLGRPDRQGSHA